MVAALQIRKPAFYQGLARIPVLVCGLALAILVRDLSLADARFVAAAPVK